MCGIVASFDAAGSPALEAVQKGLNVLRHRGPDAMHAWESADGHVCLGHTRLSIIDLETGDQPLANEDGTIHLVVNGELYDFERIRRQLESRGHRFRTHSDSEILLHLYEDLGAECVHELRGEYAFVLWDSRKRVLLAGRDRFGIKPLFYAQVGDRLLFASEVKALHAAGVRAAWDESGFWQTMSMTLTPPHTLFDGISMLPPGYYLQARGNNHSLHKYWDFDFPREDSLPQARPDNECAEEFGALLDEAVRLRMRADVPVGCYLSGGIDSCSVLGLMAKHAPGRVRAFSLSFDHPMYDEGAIAKEMAELAGAEFTAIPVSHSDMAYQMSDALWHAEAFFINSGSAAKFQLSRVVRDAGYKVVLTGEGSDEVLAGYPFFRMDLTRSQQSAEAAQQNLKTSNAASAGLTFASGQVAPLAAFVDHLGFSPTLLEARKDSLEKMGAALNLPATPDALLGSLLDRLDVSGQMKGRPVVSQSQYIMNKTIFPNYILVCLGDRVEMAHSVEGRLPFLDHHLVEYVRKLPIEQKIRGTVEKHVLREAMKPVITERVYKREKHPFLAPPVMLRPEEPLHALLQDTLRGKALERVPFLRREGVVEYLDRATSADTGGKIAMEAPLMLMLSACLMAERFGL